MQELDKNSRIYIAGKNGMVGRAIWRKLEAEGYTELYGTSSSELDLRDQQAVQTYFEQNRFDVVIDAAARVGGILANSKYPYQFLMDNLSIQNNLINASHTTEVSKFVFLGSSCIYPRLAEQPLREDALLEGQLEPTNQWYAVAKICGVKACEAIRVQYDKDFFSLMPTNLYGPHDNFDLQTSHVLPAMIRKFHDAKTSGKQEVMLWGSGTPLREFLHVDDVASAVFFTLNNRMEDHLYNVGSGTDISIKDLAETIKAIVGFKGDIVWDSSKPDGTPRKLMDVSRLAKQGWNYQIKLEDGIKATYQWFLTNHDQIKEVQIS